MNGIVLMAGLLAAFDFWKQFSQTASDSPTPNDAGPSYKQLSVTLSAWLGFASFILLRYSVYGEVEEDYNKDEGFIAYFSSVDAVRVIGGGYLAMGGIFLFQLYRRRAQERSYIISGLIRIAVGLLSFVGIN